MRAPENQTAPVAGRGGRVDMQGDPAGNQVDRDNTREHRRTQVAVISKTASAQLRVSLTTWQGQHKLEIREATAAIPGIFFPTPNGITLDLDKIPDLIAGLQAAEAEARARGLLPERGRAA
jgi:hypothetical protein